MLRRDWNEFSISAARRKFKVKQIAFNLDNYKANSPLFHCKIFYYDIK